MADCLLSKEIASDNIKVPICKSFHCSVKCWDSGKLLVCQNPRESEANEKWGVVPLKHKIRLPKPVEAGTARALVTLHGQLYISVSCPKLVGRPRKVPGTSAQPSSKAQGIFDLTYGKDRLMRALAG